jgi:hypothetical protein
MKQQSPSHLYPPSPMAIASLSSSVFSEHRPTRRLNMSEQARREDLLHLIDEALDLFDEFLMIERDE